MFIKTNAFFVIIFLSVTSCSEAESSHIRTLLNPAPYGLHSNFEYSNDDYHIFYNQRNSQLFRRILNEKVFKIGPSDAIDVTKYSQPAVDNNQEISSPSVKVPSKIRVSTLSGNRNSELFKEQTSESNIRDFVPKRNIYNSTTRDSRLIENVPYKNPHASKNSFENEYLFHEEQMTDMQSDMSHAGNISNVHERNNFTDADNNFLPVSSDSVLSYQPSGNVRNQDVIEDKTFIRINSDQNKSSHLNRPFIKPILASSVPSVLPELNTQRILFNTHHYGEILNQTDSTDSILSATLLPSNYDESNFSSGLPLLDDEIKRISSGAVAGIVIAVLVCVTLLSSAVIYLLYRKYNGKCTSVVESKFNNDNCGYLDDSLRSSIYLNNHIELPKESSEEMSSLDNDSFLNSLETMTIQNYWADNSKNTKV